MRIFRQALTRAANAKSANAETKSAFAAPVSATPEMISATAKMVLAFAKMISADGFWVKNGKKPGFPKAAGTDWCANPNGTDLKRAV